MSDPHVQIGEGELESWFVVNRADGRQEFFKVVGDDTIEITEAEYAALEEGR